MQRIGNMATGVTIFDTSDDGHDDANWEGGPNGYDYEPHGGSGAFDGTIGGDRGGGVAGGDRGGGGTPSRAPATGEQPAG